MLEYAGALTMTLDGVMWHLGQHVPCTPNQAGWALYPLGNAAASVPGPRVAGALGF